MVVTWNRQARNMVNPCRVPATLQTCCNRSKTRTWAQGGLHGDRRLVQKMIYWKPHSGGKRGKTTHATAKAWLKGLIMALQNCHTCWRKTTNQTLTRLNISQQLLRKPSHKVKQDWCLLLHFLWMCSKTQTSPNRAHTLEYRGTEGELKHRMVMYHNKQPICIRSALVLGGLDKTEASGKQPPLHDALFISRIAIKSSDM